MGKLLKEAVKLKKLRKIFHCIGGPRKWKFLSFLTLHQKKKPYLSEGGWGRNKMRIEKLRICWVGISYCGGGDHNQCTVRDCG